MSASEEEVRKRVVGHVLKHGDDLEFTKYFWKGCEPLPNDVHSYSEYTRLLGAPTTERHDGASTNLRKKYGFERISPTHPPKLGLYLEALLALGQPAPGFVWLNTEASHGDAHPIGNYVQVPTKISVWNEVEGVLTQLNSLGEPTREFSKS